jgi:hypothetical protein
VRHKRGNIAVDGARKAGIVTMRGRFLAVGAASSAPANNVALDETSKIKIALLRVFKIFSPCFLFWNPHRIPDAALQSDTLLCRSDAQMHRHGANL